MVSTRFTVVRNILFVCLVAELIFNVVNVATIDESQISTSCAKETKTPDDLAACVKLSKTLLYSTLAIGLTLEAIIMIGICKENYCIVTTVAVLYTMAAIVAIWSAIGRHSSAASIIGAIVTVLDAGLSIALSRFIAYGEGNSARYGV